MSRLKSQEEIFCRVTIDYRLPVNIMSSLLHLDIFLNLYDTIVARIKRNSSEILEMKIFQIKVITSHGVSQRKSYYVLHCVWRTTTGTLCLVRRNVQHSSMTMCIVKLSVVLKEDYT